MVSHVDESIMNVVIHQTIVATGYSQQFDTNGVPSTHPPLLDLLFLLARPITTTPPGHQDGNSFDTRVSSLVALNDGRQTLNLTGTNDSQVLR